jgi:hypothetical protein
VAGVNERRVQPLAPEIPDHPKAALDVLVKPCLANVQHDRTVSQKPLATCLIAAFRPWTIGMVDAGIHNAHGRGVDVDE